MSNRLPAALAVVAALALASCGAPSTADFARKAAMTDLYLIAAGQVASERGQSDAVKQFGQLMVETHGKLNEKLKGLVEAEKLDVKLQPRLDRRRQESVEALSEAKPEDFDELYAEQQVRAHNLAVRWFDEYAEEGDNLALKQFAANTLPILEQQRGEAEKLPQ